MVRSQARAIDGGESRREIENEGVTAPKEERDRI
jgi:hypothetical protein